jgi:predicted alpha/beta superfamily hydrolase
MLMVLSMAMMLMSQDVEPKSTVVGDLRLIEHRSALLQNTRTLRVWLPPGYEASDARYPVLYMHDGQNLFDEATSFVGEWRVDETLTELIESGQVTPVIVVGIDNSGMNRVFEYTPVRHTMRRGDETRETGGGGDAYVSMVVDEIKPLIDAAYRTKPEPQHTLLAGSSLGGLISLHAAMIRPGVFGAIGAVSPSLWWGEGELIARIEQDASPLDGVRIWLDMGSAEGSTDESGQNPHVAATRRLAGALEHARVPHRLEIIEGGEHNERAWSARFAEIARYLLPKPE